MIFGAYKFVQKQFEDYENRNFRTNFSIFAHFYQKNAKKEQIIAKIAIFKVLKLFLYKLLGSKYHDGHI